MSENSLHDRVAVVTGAAGDIGLAIVARYLEAGCKVGALDADGDALAQRCKARFGRSPNLLPLACDVSDPVQTCASVAAVVRRWQALHVLVNNAATVTPTSRISDIDVEHWRRAINVNLTGAWLMSKWAIAHMAESGGGVVLNIASQLGHVAAAGRGAYGVSKAGLLALTRSIAVDHAAQGIRAVSLSPGAIMTSRLLTRYGSADEVSRTLGPRYPLAHIGCVDDVAEAALFLAGDKASFVTGTDLLIDGGYTAV